MRSTPLFLSLTRQFQTPSLQSVSPCLRFGSPTPHFPSPSSAWFDHIEFWVHRESSAIHRVCFAQWNHSWHRWYDRASLTSSWRGRSPSSWLACQAHYSSCLLIGNPLQVVPFPGPVSQLTWQAPSSWTEAGWWMLSLGRSPGSTNGDGFPKTRHTVWAHQVSQSQGLLWIAYPSCL
jgi:hypothetical protein